MTRILIAAALTAAIASPAAAQVAGVYAGTAKDGSPVSFTVSLDQNNVLAVTSDSVDFTATCKVGGSFGSGWGWGSDDVIASHKASGNLEIPYTTILWNLKFAPGGSSATGFVSVVAPTLSPVGPLPKKALLCRSLRQAMTLTLQPGAAEATPPVQGAVLHDRTGHPIAVTTR